MMKLYRTATGYIVEEQNQFHVAENANWDELITGEGRLRSLLAGTKAMTAKSFAELTEMNLGGA